MGGSGSGPRRPGRPFVSDCIALSIDDLARAGMIRTGEAASCVVEWTGANRTRDGTQSVQVRVDPTRSGRLNLALQYCVTRAGDARDMVLPVKLTTSPTCYQGRRHWFVCPACYRRCGKLHLPPGQEVFACRRCFSLWYRSQLRGSGQNR